MYAPKRAQYVSKACALKSLRSTNKEHTNRSFFDSSACFCKSEDRATERCGSLEVATRRETVLKGKMSSWECTKAILTWTNSVRFGASRPVPVPFLHQTAIGMVRQVFRLRFVSFLRSIRRSARTLQAETLQCAAVWSVGWHSGNWRRHRQADVNAVD